MVPQGGYWRDLPIDIQREYMKGSFNLPGGKTGMARRLSWNAPSLTLTCAPAQNQTERCHPEESRPLTVREYARIQTFPDDWSFTGIMTSQYKQIGNAVPVNFAKTIGKCLVQALNSMEEKMMQEDNAKHNIVPSVDIVQDNGNKELPCKPESQILFSFENKTVYVVQKKPVLLYRNCLQDEIDWIQKHNIFCCNVSKDALDEKFEILNIRFLILQPPNAASVRYAITGYEIVSRSLLDSIKYPSVLENGKDELYILFNITPYPDEIPGNGLSSAKIHTNDG